MAQSPKPLAREGQESPERPEPDAPAKHGFALALNCEPCHRWVILVREEMQATRRGQQSYIEMNFRCSECGAKADKQLRSPWLGMKGKARSQQVHLIEILL
jgi:ribosomal protein L37E